MERIKDKHDITEVNRDTLDIHGESSYKKVKIGDDLGRKRYFHG